MALPWGAVGAKHLNNLSIFTQADFRMNCNDLRGLFSDSHGRRLRDGPYIFLERNGREGVTD